MQVTDEMVQAMAKAIMDELDRQHDAGRGFFYDTDDLNRVGIDGLINVVELARAALTAALAAAPAPTDADATLPCDVLVAPATRFRAGVAVSTLMLAIEERRSWPAPTPRISDRLVTMAGVAGQDLLSMSATVGEVMRERDAALARAEQAEEKLAEAWCCIIGLDDAVERYLEVIDKAILAEATNALEAARRTVQQNFDTRFAGPIPA